MINEMNGEGLQMGSGCTINLLEQRFVCGLEMSARDHYNEKTGFQDFSTVVLWLVAAPDPTGNEAMRAGLTCVIKRRSLVPCHRFLTSML